jgi:KaiC/GvpD/RAD55 family RecA-like ATPase
LTEASQFAGGARIDIRPTTSDDCKPVFDKVDQWQKDLIDLSRRNTALYLTDKRAEKQVEITSPSLQELFDRLVQRGVSLDFPMPIYEQPTSLNSTSERKDKPQESIRKGDLEANLPVAELQLRLRRLRRDRLTSQEEQGIHTLFLAVAFLRWKEKSQFGGEEDEYLAPIILVPVELDRKSVDDPYFIRLSEEDIVANPALIFKLKTDFGIALPELPEELDKESVIGYLEEVEDATKNRGWQVMRNVRLDRFTYEKFVMYNDLTDHKQDACLHPIIRALAKTSSIPDDDFQVPDNLDDGVNPCELFPILDADSSQMEALLRFHRGQNLVIQGPPGTGKSQTIANLISQGLRDGKKILFVSEKMAALEVVLRRLQSAELSFACLEVHSHKSDKLKVVKELANTLEQSQYEEVAPDADQQYQRLIKLRDRLNEYAKELHKTRGGQKLSAFDVHGRLAKILNAPAVEFRLPVDSVVQMTSDQLDEFVSAIHKIKDIEGVFDNLDRHPWRGVEFMATDVSGLALDPFMLVDNLMSTLKSLKDDVSKLQEEASSIVTGLGIEKPATVAEMDGLIKAVELLSKPQVILGQWTTLSTKELGTLISQTRELRELHRQLEENKTKLTRIFRLDLLQLPVGLMLSRFESQYRTPLRFLKTDYRHDMSLLLSHSSSTRRIRYEEARKSLALAMEIIALQNRIDSLKVALGQFYQEVETAWDQDIGGLEWLSQILRELGRSDFPPKLRELVQHPDQLTPLCEGALARLKPLSSEINKGIHKIETVMKSYSIDGGTLANAPFPKLESWLDEKRNQADLQNWLSYQRAKQNCQKLGLDPFLDAAKKEGTSAKDLEIAFMRRIWKAWLAEAYRESPVLQDFVATSHERIIQEFSYVDERVKLVTAKIVRQKIAKSQPKAEAGTVAESQMGIILREAKKKRRVMPLRKLFATTPQLIQDLKPCMLMSPLSVASYLGTSPYHFDWVIFDEASQIPPADAIGAILRGTHLIVVGDDKQLPPTTFFQAGLDFNEESEEGPEEPLESVLDECLTIPRFKKVFLKWHYRSKREELSQVREANLTSFHESVKPI